MNNFNDFFESFLTKIGNILPGVAGAILVLIIGFIIAYAIKRFILYLFKKTKWDEKINSKLSPEFKFDTFIAKLVYYLVLVYVLVIVLGMMGVESQGLAPLSDMFSEFTSLLPNLVKAVVIGVTGYVVAKLISEALGFLASSLEASSKKYGFSKDQKIGKLVKQLIFILIFVPILVVALDALNMHVITDPAKQMFSEFLLAVPNIIAAGLILAVFYYVGKYLVNFLVDILSGLGIDRFSDSIGFGDSMKDKKLSAIIGKVVFFFIIFTGIIAALEKLQLPQVSGIFNTVLDMSGNIILGLVVLLIGNYLSKIAKKAVVDSENSIWLANFARIAVLGIFFSLGIHTMGIGQDIVNIAFGITAGALGIAFAVAFGIGGKKSAEKYISRLMDRNDDHKKA